MTEQLSARTLSRVSRRLLPFLFALYVFAYLDRVNVGYAALFIRSDLHFSDTVYGTGAGLFFLSYALFEVPSNLILLRLGPRRWISILMVVWGAISASMPLVRSPAEFYLLRFLLGAAEAGFFPGIILYLTFWFPRQQRARAIALFMSATAVAGVVGAPLSNLLLRLDGVKGVAGWKWLFVGEGLPSILLGALVFFMLTDTPDEAGWLHHDERVWLTETLAGERADISAAHSVHLRDVWRNTVLWRLAFIYFAISVGLYSLSLWLPVVLKQLSHASDLHVILLTAVPYLLAAIAMVLIAHSSDRKQERRWHLVASLLGAAAGFALSVVLQSPWMAMAALFLAVAGIWGCFGPFWALPTAMLRGTAAAGGIAIVNSVGALGGFCGPYLMGRVSDATHSFHAALAVAAGLLLVAAAIASKLRAS
ncbi:MAG TPA: MFS transporter [Pseudacidobacterium sp.]|nr:MFS transporter [Pseudacidobacterium sp.]